MSGLISESLCLTACRKWLEKGSWIYLKSSWLSVVVQLTELVKLVLRLVEFFAKLVEVSSGESRWKGLK